jgi:hypothetical protein
VTICARRRRVRQSVAARARARAASTSRSRGGCWLVSEAISRRAESATSSIAVSNAAALARDGWAKPESLRTNWRAAARISSSPAGGSKLNRVLMLRHIGRASCGAANQGRPAPRDGHSDLAGAPRPGKRN